ENAARYQQEGADELAMLDIAATLENRKTRLEWVRNVSAVIEIPLTVGGGISTLEDIELLFEAGADKVSMNSAAVNRPALVSEAAKAFGSERITVAIDARRNSAMPSGFELVVSGGTKAVGKDAIAWAKQCEALGAGVILPTSMDGDGTQAGYDIPFTRAGRREHSAGGFRLSLPAADYPAGEGVSAPTRPRGRLVTHASIRGHSGNPLVWPRL
nr:HisA/HisF-related TIM barrel protein [Candidatus Contendobacter sp.]